MKLKNNKAPQAAPVTTSITATVVHFEVKRSRMPKASLACDVKLNGNAPCSSPPRPSPVSTNNPFPLREVERVIAKELIFLSALQPLDLCYQTLLAQNNHQDGDVLRPALTDALLRLASAAKRLVRVMIHLLEHNTQQSLLHQASPSSSSAPSSPSSPESLAALVVESASVMQEAVSTITQEYQWMIQRDVIQRRTIQRRRRRRTRRRPNEDGS